MSSLCLAWQATGSGFESSFASPLLLLTHSALSPLLQISVSDETLEVWCTMAECLGWDSMKSEMEDLCFAVMQPEQYCRLRSVKYMHRGGGSASMRVCGEGGERRGQPG